MIAAGAVNGVPTKINVRTPGTLTIPFATSGVAGTLSVQPSGAPHAPVGGGPDRVAIIGGSTSGRDHFPWPVPDGAFIATATYPAQYFPLSLSLVDAMKWVWKVKKWKLAGAITFDVTRASDSTTATYTVTYDLNVYGFDSHDFLPLDRESKLVILYGVFVFDGDTTFSGGFAGAPTPEFFDNGMGILNSDYPSMVSNEDLFYPQIDFVAQIDGNPDPPEAGTFFRVRLTTRNVDVDILDDPSTIEEGISIDGHPLPLFCSVNTDNATVSNVQSTLTLAPIEFWPYATKGGLPVYDTATGAQLRDPFS